MIFLAMLLLVSGLAAQPALADTAPVDPTNPVTPVTVSADALPTPQIDGIAWTQKIVGDQVYAGGNFQTARPSGAASGVSTVPRTDLLAYDLKTGVLNTAFAPVLNGQVRTIASSPDGSVLYIGGSFTTVNGVTRNRIAALDATTGSLINSFNPNANATVYTIATSGNTVYFGGGFTSVAGVARQGFAASSAGGALLAWSPVAAGGSASSIVVSPDATKLVLGGSFTSLNGSTNPGYGLGAVDATTGALLPWNINSVVRDGGIRSGITSLTSDATGVYGSGYVYNDGAGNLEGTFKADWATGDVIWVESCHGDSYSLAPTADAVYVAGHPYDCSSMPGGFPYDGTYHRAIAFTKSATVTTSSGPFSGQPAPSLLDWLPQFNTGTASGSGQGPWSVAASGDYVVYGGEFTTVNGVGQQGLTRFANPSIAPNKQGPQVTGAQFVPTVAWTGAGTARVSWTSDWDRDNATLVYKVFRNGGSTPVYTTTSNSTFFNRPTLSFTDTGLPSGVTNSYRISATDPFGNTTKGDGVSLEIAPTAKFTSTLSGQVLTVDASASKDLDGTIASYAWNFGDGSTSTGVTATHTYTTPGTYPITLTVTDNQGASTIGTASTVINAPTAAGVLAQDAFGRTVTSGWGTADIGGAWAKAGTASNLAVSTGAGVLSLPTAGTQIGATLSALSSTSTDLTFSFADDKAPTGGGTYISAIGRSLASGTDYRATARLQASGAVGLSLSALSGNASTTLVSEKTVPGLTAAAGSTFQIRLQVTGTSPTTVRAKVWNQGATEPTTWFSSATDSTASLQAPGSIGVLAYLSGSSTNAKQTVQVTGLVARNL